MPHRILIADDEPLARERLRRLVQDLADCEVCGEAADGQQVLHEVAKCGPDIVLLDIRMPGMDGMETAEQLTRLENPPAIIFCTAYDQYAIEAFRVQAVDYLLKPVRREALAEALERARKLNRVQVEALREKTSTDDSETCLAIRNHRGTELIDLAHILYCQADQKYVTIVHDEGEAVTDFTLKELESSHPDIFLRIHRQTLVARQRISGLQRDAQGQYRVRLRGTTARLDVSRRHATDIRHWLSGRGLTEDSDD